MSITTGEGSFKSSSPLDFQDQVRSRRIIINENDRVQLVRNEPLIQGYALLRVTQLLNIDIYNINLVSPSKRSKCDSNKFKISSSSNSSSSSSGSSRSSSSGIGLDVDVEASGVTSSTTRLFSSAKANSLNEQNSNDQSYTILDELASYNPLQKLINRYHFLGSLCGLLKICLSLSAIIFSFDKAISTIILCIMTRGELKSNAQATTNSSMGMFVLMLLNVSFLYVLFTTIFNGHLLWNLLSQRLFLVEKRFQYKIMAYLLIFVYLEYMINIAFVNNLYEWDFTSNNIESGSYSVLANLRVFVTEKDVDHYGVDVVLTLLQFARGIIYISPYITVNYVIICLRKHIYMIRNQHLLTESLKKRTKLRLTVRNRNIQDGKQKENTHAKEKRVIFKNEEEIQQLETISGRASLMESNNGISGGKSSLSSFDTESKISSAYDYHKQQQSRTRSTESRGSSYLSKISDFDELESYITNLYIFTGRLNRIMSQQGITVFFIVHNLLISVSILMPETIHGGFVMVYLIRALMIGIALMPFVFGQSLNAQLVQLSKQLDRIIIQQQFIHHRRDNLVRIRELVHDIRVNCGGMLNFNVETGIKYLVIAFASAFFIEQERKFLALSLSVASHTLLRASRVSSSLFLFPFLPSK